MKGYKASINSVCNGFTYEVGETYTLTEPLRICKSGFHFCKKASDTLHYYDCKKDFVLFEVEALGETVTEGDKSVSNKIKIVSVVPKEKYEELLNIKVDKNDNLIYKKDSNGIEYWNDYDKKNNMIHCKDSSGYEFWKDYDEKNKLIHCKDSSGYEYWREYDKNNNVIHSKNSNGIEYWYDYDEKNNLIHSRDSNGLEYWYNEHGKEISKKVFLKNKNYAL